MIFVVSVLALLSICRGDVSHLDTELRDDGYHYKQPYRPFSIGKNELDDQFNFQPGSRTQPTNKAPAAPTSEYLPPDEEQQVSNPSSKSSFPTQPTQPAKDYGPPSTFLPQTPAEPTKEYGRPTTFIPQTPTSAYPQRPKGKTFEKYGPPSASSSQTPQLRPTTFAPASGPQKPRLPLTPEREYLPPGENEINKEQKPSPKFPIQQTTLPAPQSKIPQSRVTPERTTFYQSPTPKYFGPEPTNKGSQSTYQAGESTYASLQPTFPVPQQSPTYETGPQSNEPESEESEPAHELGPEGYKYKVPSNKFRY